nr:K(+) efflux antiporter 6 isoform X2 [Malus domestica]
MLRRSSSSSSLGFLAVVVPALLLLSSDLLFSLSLADPLAAADDSVTDSDLLLSANATESNVSLSKPKEGSFADMIDKALENEFKENDQNEATDPGSFNNSVAGQQAVLETVARVKSKKNETKEEKSFQLHDVFNLDNDNRGEDTPTLIDRKDNVFIISNFKSKYPVLQLDLRLISDLVVVIVSATCGGIAFACAGQPVISGYLLAGSVIGPGGFNFVSEMVQVETVAQFGVIFLLFALGLEFSTAKLRVVRAVAVPGGLLQIFLFMCLCGITASLCGGKVSEGIFVGVFLSMSSTAVVLKFLMEKNSTNALHGQVTIGTLILQDCAVGLLFALLPVLGGTSGILQGVMSMAKLMVTLITFLAVLSISSRTCVPWLLKLMISLSSQTNELYQLASVAFCLLVAWCSDKLGLSLELGSFAAGVMISTTDLAQHTLEQVGISLAQIGEFAFVLLSRASNLHLVEGKLYLLLLGTTALSLVTTPFLFKLIPGLVHLGVLLRWFPPDGAVEIGFKGENLRSESGKQRVILMVRESHDS